MNRRETIKSLLYNISLEHSAIIQYFVHSLLIDEPEIRSELEEIAREEMRHLKYFAHKVRELGGTVTIERNEEELKIDGPEWEKMIQINISAEDRAIEVYSAQLDSVKDDSIKRLLERVIKDETAHREKFGDLLEEVKRKYSVSKVARSPASDEEEIFSGLFTEEYRNILEYLHAYFNDRSCPHSHRYLDIAIESMVHMGKIGEHLSEKGVLPDLSKPEVEEVDIASKVIKEEGSLSKYDDALEKVEDREARKLIGWIRNHEIYHVSLLKDILSSSLRLTVGRISKKEGKGSSQP